jgi:hypothetical protein
MTDTWHRLVCECGWSTSWHQYDIVPRSALDEHIEHHHPDGDEPDATPEVEER